MVAVNKTESRLWEVVVVLIGVLCTAQLAATGWIFAAVVEVRRDMAVTKAGGWTSLQQVELVSVQATADLEQWQAIAALKEDVAGFTSEVVQQRRELDRLLDSTNRE